MKQFIVLAAVLPLMMIFVMQAGYDQKNGYAISLIHDIVYASKEEAKAEGSFTSEIQNRLRKNLSRALDVAPREISIFCKEEGDTLYYRVEAPIKRVVAGNKLLGIKDEENQYTYVIDSYTKSIKPYRPEPEPEPETEPEPEPEPDEL